MHLSTHIGARRKLAALVMIACFSALGLALCGGAEMDELLKNYETHAAKVVAPVDAKLIEDLKTFESRLAADGKLEAAIAIKSARLSLAIAPEKALQLSEFDAKHPEEGKTLAKVRRNHAVRHSNALRPARLTLVSELAKLEKKLTESGQLKQALAAQKKRESVATEIAWGSMRADIPAKAVAWNGHFYFMFEKKMSWKQARAHCMRLRGDLVSITSREENDLVLKLSRKQNCWLGGTDEAKEGTWEWVSKEPFEFTKWNSRPDNHRGNQHYLFYWVGRGWDDTSGSAQHGFICEWQPRRN